MKHSHFQWAADAPLKKKNLKKSAFRLNSGVLRGDIVLCAVGRAKPEC